MNFAICTAEKFRESLKGALYFRLGLESAGRISMAERVERAVRFSHFDELARQEREHGFRERPLRSERFFREGRSGGWRSQLSATQIRRIVADHGVVMRRFGYLDEHGEPC